MAEPHVFHDVNKPNEKDLGPVGAPMKEEHFLRGSTQFLKDCALLKFEAVEKAIAAGAKDINVGDVLDQTPIILLSRNRYDPDDIPKAVRMIELLVKNGAKVLHDRTGRCIRDQYGDSMLHLAAMQTGTNNHLVLKALVDALPEATRSKLVSEKCKNFGNTALHWATLTGNVEACSLLIEAGSTLTRKNKQREDVLAYANKYEHVKLKVKYEALLEKVDK
jgi:ankyrin repeat protein